MNNTSDPVMLLQSIHDMKKLYNDWSQDNLKPVDVEECGGGTITQIEVLGEAFLDMEEAFVKLLENTISYMEGRAEAIGIQDEWYEAAIGN